MIWTLSTELLIRRPNSMISLRHVVKVIAETTMETGSIGIQDVVVQKVEGKV